MKQNGMVRYIGIELGLILQRTHASPALCVRNNNIVPVQNRGFFIFFIYYYHYFNRCDHCYGLRRFNKYSCVRWFCRVTATDVHKTIYNNNTYIHIIVRTYISCRLHHRQEHRSIVCNSSNVVVRFHRYSMYSIEYTVYTK